MPSIEFTYLPIDTDLSFIQVRSVKYWGVERIKKSMIERGFLDGKPVEVARVDGGLRLFEGRHRWEAAKLTDTVTRVPALVHEDLSDEEQYRRAFLANDAAEDAVPKTFMDDAEMIWGRLHDGWTQGKIAETFGWSQPRVACYANLEKICTEARQIIITTLEEECNNTTSSDVIDKITHVITSPFSEGLLRSIINLLPAQQVELVTGLVKGRLGKEDHFDKSKFKVMAERYHGRNTMLAESGKRLSGLPVEHIDRIYAALDQKKDTLAEKHIQTVYDKEWIEQQKHTGPKFEQLVQGELKAFNKLKRFELHEGDFREILTQLKAESIDVILTDPPYGHEYLGLYSDLARLANFVLKPGGSLLVMCGQSYLPDIFKLMTAHIAYHWTISYDTPGGQAVSLWQRQVNSFWKPVLWFVKGDYKGNWQGDKAASAVNDNDKHFHQWGQSESGMLSLVERFTQPSDVILDPMMGAGTTGVAALMRNRHGVLRRADGRGDAWANLHRDNLTNRYLMLDLDGWLVREKDLERRENTEDLTFVEIVPDHQKTALIRQVYYVAIFDRKASDFAVAHSKKTLGWYLNLCRKVSTDQPLNCRFIYVIGGQSPPWKLVECDIHTAKFGEPVELDSRHQTWVRIWQATGLTGARNLFEQKLGTYQGQ